MKRYINRNTVIIALAALAVIAAMCAGSREPYSTEREDQEKFIVESPF